MSIHRGAGTTPSERKLAEIADKTFLELWSYPNTFIDKKQHGSGDGKELCDLLVVCGNDVIIFSDKSVEWPSIADVDLAWSRWYKRAVKKSVSQIRGAASWIKKFPERVFLDAQCTKRLPVEFPRLDAIRIHGIAVAVGASSACKAYMNENIGTFIVNPQLKGDEHINKTALFYAPFTLGDVDIDGPFVHVFDEIALDILIYELTTITDFVDYLVH